MSYGSYNVLEKSYKYNTIACTSNYKFITLNDYIYLKEYPRISSNDKNIKVISSDTYNCKKYENTCKTY